MGRASRARSYGQATAVDACRVPSLAEACVLWTTGLCAAGVRGPDGQTQKYLGVPVPSPGSPHGCSTRGGLASYLQVLRGRSPEWIRQAPETSGGGHRSTAVRGGRGLSNGCTGSQDTPRVVFTKAGS